MLLKNKVALITGGAQGLGLAFAEILLEHETKVSFCDINDDTGQETLRKLQSRYGENKVMFQKCNVTSQTEMEEFFRQTKARFGSVNIVVNNAGVGGETNTWEQTIAINLNGMIRGSHLALEYLRTDKGGNGGVIINVSSAAGLRENPVSPVYCASKSGILAFSRCLACNADNINNGVRVNVICPAFADTALVSDVIEDDRFDTNEVKKLIDMVGIMTTREVAEGLLELVTDDSKNGAILKMAKNTGKEYVKLECQSADS